MQNKIIGKKYYDELNIFRAFIVAWVVIGHSFVAEHSLLGFFEGYAYSFHMPAFFILSGFLFCSKREKCANLKQIGTIILDRIKRLIVPYLFFSAVSYVLKIFFEKYAENQLQTDIKSLIIDILLGQNNPNGGLWFLYALFIISVVFSFTKRINTIWLLAISFALKMVTFFVEIQITPLLYFAQYAFFFALGFLIKEHYEQIEKIFSKIVDNKSSKTKFTILTIAMLIASVGFVYGYRFYCFEKIIDFPLCLYNTVLWYFISVLANKTKVLKKCTMVVGNYGMDIYMLGYYVQNAILVILGKMLGLPYEVYSLLMVIFGILLPIPISKFIVRRVGIFKMIMLGDFPKTKKEIK